MTKLNQYLRKHQKKCLEQLNLNKDKCLVNMWCGTGKTRTFTIKTFLDNYNLTVFVFPSLGLINQYNNDYILNREEPFCSQFKNYKTLSFCSDDESKLKLDNHDIKYTTDTSNLLEFLHEKNDKIISVTYKSFNLFVSCCIYNKININRLVYDEAHHIVGEKIQDVIFNNQDFDDIVDYTEFWTATPVNRNGIIMYDDENNDENIDCGPCVYKYMCYQAIEDNICKPIETQVCLYTILSTYESKYQAIFEIIIRAFLSKNT